jgi:hypothetical protein
VDATGDRPRVQEYWTLSKRRGQWILQSIEQGREGTHALTDEIVATPWSDEKTFHDQAQVEEAQRADGVLGRTPAGGTRHPRTSWVCGFCGVWVRVN